MAQGNFSSVKGVGGGVHEYRIDFGPAYRIYFGKDGDELVILLGGGTKKGSSTISQVRCSAGKATNSENEQRGRWEWH